MTKKVMYDIKVIDKKLPGVDLANLLPENIERRKFFKYAAISGVSAFSFYLINKLNNIKGISLEGGDATTNNGIRKSKINSLAFTESKKDMVFYDKDGNELLIFEK